MRCLMLFQCLVDEMCNAVGLVDEMCNAVPGFGL